MIQKIKSTILAAFITSVFIAMISMASCTKIEEGDFLIPAGLPEWKGQYVLLEEYTGQRCPNCPVGAKTAADMSNLFGDKLIVVAMHVTDGFAGPAAGYPNDYRTEAGNVYNDVFIDGAANGLPKGMINRGFFDNERRLVTGDWAVNAMTTYKKEAVATMNVTANMSADKKINISVNANFTTEYQGDGDVHLITWIVEDSIISRQASGSTNIANYVHRHMMRGAVDGTWGQKVAESFVPAQTTINKNLQANYEDAWKPQHLYVVSLLCDNETREVIQVTETHVKIL